MVDIMSTRITKFIVLTEASGMVLGGRRGPQRPVAVRKMILLGQNWRKRNL